MNGNKNLLLGRDTHKKRARILLRVSSNQQLESDGDLTVQRQLVLEYVRSHPDWILDEKEYFEGGVSGYKNSVADRDELQKALSDAEKGEYDILVVYKDDRLGRRTLEIPSYILKLKTAGVMVYSVKDGCLLPEDNDSMDIVTLVLKYAVAEKSSADTGMRVKDTAKKLVQSGKFMGGKAPYGYILEHSGEISKHGRALKHLVIQPKQAEVVKNIYDLSLRKEYGSAKIASILNTDERYKNLAPNDVWKSGTITSILTNPIYAGYTAYNRRESLNGRRRSLDREEWILSQKTNPDLVIISEDTWQKVQRKREMRSNKYTKSLRNQDVTVIGRNDGMLSLVDVLHCGYCGCKMVNGSKYNYWTIKGTGERRTSKTAIYKCQNAWQGVPHDKTKQYRADVVEPIVFESLAEYIGKLQDNENVFERIVENNRDEKKRKEEDLEMEKKQLEKIRRGIRVMEEHIPDAMTGEYPLTLEDLVRNIDTQKDKEQKQLAVVQEKETALQNTAVTAKDWEDIKGKIPTWREMFLHADTPTKRVLVNKLIERIDITREKLTIRFKISLEEFLPKSRMGLNKVVSE
ncbi:MAG: recombinase family protein [Lachnospiraceae bacterium]|jgi:site-specific DNA recombinase|nr:recombinase family protein [Lachnospiraceae bacterium]